MRLGKILASSLPVLAAGFLLATPAAAQDAAAGEKVFTRCKACHTIEAGGANKVGPNLHGIVGRPAGTVEGFKYSDALKNSGITWDHDKLTAYLRDPRGTVPGNRMAFAGLKKDEDLANVIAYIEQASQ